MSEKWGHSANKMVYANGTALLWGFCIPSFRAMASVIVKKVVLAEDSFCYRNYKCQVSKLQHIFVIGLILLSVVKTTKHTRVYPATNYCTTLQGVKERIV